MKYNWEYKRLGEVCEKKQNIRKAKKLFSPTDEIKYIDISSIDKYLQSCSPTLYKMCNAPSRAQQCVQYGDVLISLVRPNLRNISLINYFENNLVASSGFCILRGLKLVPRYIYFLVNSEYFTQKLIKKCAGAAYPAVKDDDVKNISVPVPPRDVQERIVDELDAINEGIEELRKQAKDLDNLAQTLFYETFGDPNAKPKFPLKMVLEISENLDFKRIPITKKDRITGIYPYYGASGIVDYVSNYIFDGIYLLISEDGANLIVRSNPIAFLSEGKFWVNNHAHILDTENQCSKIFLMYYFNLLDFHEKITGAAQPKFTQKALNETKISWPPLALQEQFAKQIEEIEAMKRELEAQIAEAQTLLDSRMDYWFN